MPSDTPNLVTINRVALVLAVVFFGSLIVYSASWLLFAYAFTRSDPYPAFMADLKLTGSRTYEETKHSFSDFVVERFPIGSNMSGAVTQITRGGFEITSSTAKSVKLLWNRRAGPCSEEYSIVVSGDDAGKIAEIAGRLHPICL